MEGSYPFVLPPLPYPYHALEPYIDTETMHLHHDRHFQSYIDNLNLVLLNNPQYQKFSLEQLLRSVNRLPISLQKAITNNGGGVYNHNFFFNELTAPGNSEFPKSSRLQKALIQEFGSVENWQKQMKAAALAQFGSGYAWLVVTPKGQLRIVNTPNQNTILPQNLCPVLLIDVWEHAYYLKHKNVRANYIDNWFHVIDWDRAEENYERCLK